jgi:predicted phosphoribosyltransferase
MASGGPIDRLHDRREGGLLLAGRLAAYAGDANAIVLALPRGGVPVGFEIARALGIPLDVFIVRKLGVPGHAELAMGALASGGTFLLNDDVIRKLRIPREEVEAALERERLEIERRERLYRGDRPRPELAGKTVILVDDGLATGASMGAAIAALRRMNPARIVAAVPVAASTIRIHLGRQADELICLQTPEPFYSVGQWYENFDQTSDAEVRRLLKADG